MEVSRLRGLALPLIVLTIAVLGLAVSAWARQPAAQDFVQWRDIRSLEVGEVRSRSIIVRHRRRSQLFVYIDGIPTQLRCSYSTRRGVCVDLLLQRNLKNSQHANFTYYVFRNWLGDGYILRSADVDGVEILSSKERDEQIGRMQRRSVTINSVVVLSFVVFLIALFLNGKRKPKGV